MAQQAQATATAVRGKRIPGPRGNPVLGSIRDIQRDNIQTFMDAWREYGDIVHFRGPLTINLLVHPDYVQRVLKDNTRNYTRPKFVQDKLKSIVGEGLVANEGEVWLRSRKLTQPAFHNEIVAGLAEVFAETTGEMLEEWSAYEQRGEPVDVKSAMMQMSLTNLARALFKADLREELGKIEPAVQFALAHTQKRLTSPVDPQRFPLPSVKRFEQGLQTLDSIIYRLIAERRRGDSQGTDLVSMLLAARDEETGEGMSDEQVRDEVIGFFIAGHETVSSALSWTWYLLSKHPECWRKMKDEVDSVLDGRRPTFDDVSKLTYTTNVLWESMRLFPPIFVLMRYAVEDDEIGGYHVPAGSNIVLCAYVTHRHPDFYENPEGFDPDRFTSEFVKSLHRMAYFPFSGGPRKCIGHTFAMMEMPIVLAMVTQRYKLNLLPGLPVVAEPAISLRPRDALLMTLARVDGG
jgi:cytochrome P450